MNCPLCSKPVLRADASARCHCPADEHVHLLIEWKATAEHRADKLKDAQRMLDLREQRLADCTRAMREVAGNMRAIVDHCCVDDEASRNLARLIYQLDAARAGKAGA